MLIKSSAANKNAINAVSKSYTMGVTIVSVPAVYVNVCMKMKQIKDMGSYITLIRTRHLRPFSMKDDNPVDQTIYANEYLHKILHLEFDDKYMELKI